MLKCLLRSLPMKAYITLSLKYLQSTPFHPTPEKKNRREISNLNSLHKLSAEAETVKRERRVFAPSALQYLLTGLNNRRFIASRSIIPRTPCYIYIISNNPEHPSLRLSQPELSSLFQAFKSRAPAAFS